MQQQLLAGDQLDEIVKAEEIAYISQCTSTTGAYERHARRGWDTHRSGHLIMSNTAKETTEAERWAINDMEIIVGAYRDGQGAFHSFRYDPTVPQQARYTSFASPWPQTVNIATGINNHGVIVGLFLDVHGEHGYIKNGDQWTVLDAPGATDTEPAGLNDAGIIVGLADGHTFVYDGTAFTAVVHPDGGLTQARGITNTGELVGQYFDPQGVDHGFVARPVAETSHRGRLLREVFQTTVRRLGPVPCDPGNRQWQCRHRDVLP